MLKNFLGLISKAGMSTKKGLTVNSKLKDLLSRYSHPPIPKLHKLAEGSLSTWEGETLALTNPSVRRRRLLWDVGS